jgi:hypothetical protein
MLESLNVDQARFIALLAKTARMQRDAVLGHVAERNLGGITPGRGEHNPTAELGFEPVRTEASQAADLRDAIASLSEAARRELYALTRIGQGNLAARNFHRGLSEAEALGDNTITAAMIEDPDLHEHIAKALYETKLAS